MINLNNGFRDLRTLGELAMGAEPPLSRDAAPGFPKLGGLGVLGAVSSLAGGAAKMTSGAFAAAKLGLQARESAVAFSTSLTDAAKGFKAAGRAVQKGHASIQDVALRSTGTFASGALVQFSGMHAGPISVSSALNFSKRLGYRQARIAAMAGQFAAIASAVVAVGVIIKENRNRTPYPLEDDVDRPSLPRLAMGGLAAQLDLALRDKRRLLVSGVAIGSGAPSFWSRHLTSKLNPLKSYIRLPGFHRGLNMVFADKVGGAHAGGSWSEPEPPYAAQYPFNNVRQTESGHIEEWDDTPGAERVHIFHRSGSFVEMHPDGKVVYKSMSHGYQISMGDYNVKVKGNCNISVDGNATVHAKGEVHLQGDEDINIHTKKNFNVEATNINLRAKKRSLLDGKLIDLRYAKLPGVPVMTMQGPAVRFIEKEYERDYPLAAKKMAAQQKLKKARISAESAILGAATPLTVTAAGFAGMNSIRVLAGLVLEKNTTRTPPTDYAPELPEYDPSKPVDPENPTKPRENPLGNPLIYHATTQAALDYRELLFDTPEEVQDAVQYQAHMDTRKALKDIPETVGPVLEGNRTTPTSAHTVPENLPLVEYLTRADYYGKFVTTPPGPVPQSTILGGTSFTVGMLADSYSQSDVTIFVDKKEPPIDETAGYVEPDGSSPTLTSGTTADTTTGKPAGATNHLSVVKAVAAEIGYPSSEYKNFSESQRNNEVHQLTQMVAERLHAKDPNWGRYINNNGNLGKDSVAYRHASGHPYHIDIVAGAVGDDPHPHWSEHGFEGGWVKP